MLLSMFMLNKIKVCFLAIILFIGISETYGQIRLNENFNYNSSDSFKKDVNCISKDSSSIFGINSNKVDPYNPDRIIKSKDLGTKFLNGNAIGNQIGNLRDAWVILKTRTLINNSIDSISVWLGHLGYNIENTSETRTDSVEIWASKSGYEVANMDLFIGYAVLKDSSPSWQNFIFPLSTLKNEGFPVYFGVRYHHKNWGWNKGQSGSSVWIDCINVGRNFKTSSVKSPAIAKSSYLKLYPNPTQNKFSLQYQSLSSDKAQVQLMNTLGQVCSKVYDLQGTNGTIEIQCADLTPGLYFVQLKSENQILEYKKLIIN